MASAASLSPCFVHLIRLPAIPPVIPFKPYRRKSRVCPKCDEYFKNRKNFTKHLLHHLSHKSSLKKNILHRPPQNRKKCCPICLEEFRKKWDLIQHLATHLTNLEKIAENKRQKLKIQTKLNFRPSKLSKPSQKKSSTFIQKRIEKPKPQISKPPQSKIFSTSNSTTNRKVSAATLKTWKLACYFCGMKWPKNNRLILHMTKHTGEQPSACSFPGCHKRFKRVNSLTTHMRTHDPDDGRMRYKCQKCARKYLHRSSLYVHIRAVHLKIRNFKCTKCKKGYLRLRDLENHQEKNH